MNFTLINLTPSLTYTKWLNQPGLQEQSKPTLETSYLLKPSKPSLDIYYMLSPDSLERGLTAYPLSSKNIFRGSQCVLQIN